MNIIIWLVVGGILGWLASLVMRTDGQQGIFLNVVVGIVGALVAGFLIAALHTMLAIVLPGVGIIALATLGVWITVPDAARDCPVIGGLTPGADDAPPVALDA